MLLSSPGDNHSSLPMDSGQKQTDPTEARCSDRACLPALNGSCTDPNASEHAEIAETGSLLSSVPQRLASWRPDASVQATELDGLYALRQAADLKGLRRARGGLLSNGTLAKLAASKAAEPIETSSFAAPLSPLRVRDIQALSDFFLRDDIYAIEADVNQRLLTLLPEPCWEDKVFTFLEEFFVVRCLCPCLNLNLCTVPITRPRIDLGLMAKIRCRLCLLVG